MSSAGDRPRSTRVSSRGGFTLVEMLVVVSIIALLLAGGIGILSSLGTKQALPAATGEVTALLRRARNAAREERFPVQVIIEPELGIIRARGRRTVAHFRFEDGDATGAWVPGPIDDPDAPETGEIPLDVLAESFGVRGARGVSATAFLAEPDPDGRFGGGLRLEQEGANAVIRHQAGFSAREGLEVELWIRPADLVAVADDIYTRLDDTSIDPDEPWYFKIIGKEGVFELGITDAYAIEAAVWGEIPGLTEPIQHRVTTRERICGPAQWTRISMVFDDEGLKVDVNGMGRYAPPMQGQDLDEEAPTTLSETTNDVVIADPDWTLGFVGTVDELRISALVVGDPVRLPASVALLSTHQVIYYDKQGSLDPLRHDGPVEIVMTSDQIVIGALNELAAKAAREAEEESKLTSELPALPEGARPAAIGIVPNPGGIMDEHSVSVTRKTHIRVDRSGGLRW